MLPGLHNCHLHSGLLRGTAESMSLWDWLKAYVDPAHKALTPGDRRAASMQCYAEGLLAGTTSVMDMWRFMEGSADVAAELGLRATLVPYVADEEGFDFFESIESNRRLLESHAAAADGRVRTWVGLEHLMYCTKECFAQAVELMDEFGTGLHTHSSESIWEVEESLKRWGRRPIEVFYDRGILGPRTVVAHCVWLSDREIELLAQTDTAVAHCPTSNMKLASGPARIGDLRRAGVTRRHRQRRREGEQQPRPHRGDEGRVAAPEGDDARPHDRRPVGRARARDLGRRGRARSRRDHRNAGAGQARRRRHRVAARPAHDADHARRRCSTWPPISCSRRAGTTSATCGSTVARWFATAGRPRSTSTACAPTPRPRPRSCSNGAPRSSNRAEVDVTRWLLRGCDLVATFDDEGRELAGADVLVDDGVIEAVGVGLADAGCDRVVDGRGLVVLPGLVNAHQHLYQGATRAIPALERALIGPWLGGLGAIFKQWWQAGKFEPAHVEAIAAAVLCESLLGGVTTVADQHYFHPAGPTRPYVESTIEAATHIGVRLHACRGTLTLGPDPDVVQSVDEVVRHCEALIAAHHDPRPGARTGRARALRRARRRARAVRRAGRARSRPSAKSDCTPISTRRSTPTSRERYGRTPWELVAEHGWAQPRTWLAHVVDPPPAEIAEMAAAGVSVAHLIAPDLRMGWGCAPVRAYLDAGVTLGFGTTGSASNDGANLLGDLRIAALAHRGTEPDDPALAFGAKLLHMATRGSALCLGRRPRRDRAGPAGRPRGVGHARDRPGRRTRSPGRPRADRAVDPRRVRLRRGRDPRGRGRADESRRRRDRGARRIPRSPTAFPHFAYLRCPRAANAAASGA